MIRNRTAQLIFRTAFCTLATVAFAATLGMFDMRLKRDYPVYYTNLSNLLCMVFMFLSLIRTAIAAERKEEGFCAFAPGVKFVFMIMILITCILYNGLLADYPSVRAYFASMTNGLNHLILPVLFALDWVLFYERGTVKWTYPLLAVSLPLAYVVGILVRARIPEAAGRHARVVYPYFFLNVESLGWGSFLGWMLILLAGILVLGYGIWLADRLLARGISLTSNKG